MNLLLRFEAFESRVIPSTCPLGTAGRLHTLRLRRYSPNHALSRKQSTATAERYVVPKCGEFGVNPGNIFQQEPQQQTVNLSRHGGHKSQDVEAQAPRAHTSKRQYEGYMAKIRRGVEMENKKVYDRVYRLYRAATEAKSGDLTKQQLAKLLPKSHAEYFWSHRFRRHRGIWREATLLQRKQALGVFGLADRDAFNLSFSRSESRQLDNSPEIGLAKNQLWDALQSGEAAAVVEALMNFTQVAGAFRTTLFLKSLSQPVFSEILRCLNPQYLVTQYQDFMRQSSVSDSRILHVPLMQEGSYAFAVHFLSFAHELVRHRHYSDVSSVVDMKYLLAIARATGQAEAAHRIWSTFTRRRNDPIKHPKTSSNEIVPDLECYNHLMGAMLWQESNKPLQRLRLRVIPNNFEPRQWDHPPPVLSGHRVNRPDGLSARVSAIFKKMVANGIAGNEETFCLMITALAREGDLSGIASILKRVWDIDLMNTTENPLPKTCSVGSPIYPSSELLFVLAHSYGINNDVPTALQLVDLVSRQYSIPIPLRVWKELLEWTYVLSCEHARDRKRRARGKKELGHDIGELPRAAVSHLWSTMTSAPYNIEPTIEMYDFLIKNLLFRQRFQEAEIYMLEARRLLTRTTRHFSRQFMRLSLSSMLPASQLEKGEFDLAFQQLRIRRYKEYIRQWVRQYIKSISQSLRSNPAVSGQTIPRWVENWSIYLPRTVKYRCQSGVVELKPNVRMLNRRRQSRRFAMDPAEKRAHLDKYYKEKWERQRLMAGRLEGSLSDENLPRQWSS